MDSETTAVTEETPEETVQETAKTTGDDTAETTGDDIAETTGDDIAETTGDDIAETTGDDIAETTGDGTAETTGDGTTETPGDETTEQQQEVTPEQSEEQPPETQPESVSEDVDQNQNNAAEGDGQPATEGEGEANVTEGQEEQATPVTEDSEVKTEEGGEQPGDGEVQDTPQPSAEGEDQGVAAVEAEAGDAQEKGETEEGKSGEEAGGETPAEAETPQGDTGEEPTPDSAGGEVSLAEGELPLDSETPADEEQTALQSEKFTEGERPESPLAVGEKLSREGSPIEDLDDIQPEALEPGTPDQVSEAGEETTPQELMDIEEDEVQPEIDRAQLIERYHAAISERDQFQQQNYQLQHKIAEYFRKKKSDESRQDFDKNVSDQEQRYIKYMANLEELRKQEGQETEHYHVQIEELKERCQEKQERVEAERVRFAEFKKQVALNSINSRSGKTIPPKDIEQYLSTENRKDKDVVNVRLENIKLKNKLKKKEQQLKSKEELAEGLHLIDFEQLKIENQTYNEKIEERNEELLKLRKKITSTVQVLTHLKEKLQFVQAENQVQNTRLRDVESVAAQKRDILSRTKQARDALRIDNQKLRQNCGLLGNEPLLRDFEEQRDESDGLKMKLEKLRMQHAELTLNCNQVRRKIEQARMNQL